jgi:hypothetical protein
MVVYPHWGVQAALVPLLFVSEYFLQVNKVSVGIRVLLLAFD